MAVGEDPPIARRKHVEGDPLERAEGDAGPQHGAEVGAVGVGHVIGDAVQGVAAPCERDGSCRWWGSTGVTAKLGRDVLGSE
jgi:hypothetical protein